MSLYSEFLSLFSERTNEWNYYGHYFVNPIHSEEYVSEFIKQYFKYGEKGSVINDRIIEIDPMRHRHTVSAFFLGILIKEGICSTLEINFERMHQYQFSYLWFLVCLFHDMGYCIENNWTYKSAYRYQTEEFKRRYKNNLHQSYFSKQQEMADLGILYTVPCRFAGMNSFSVVGQRYRMEQINTSITFSNGIVIDKSMYSRRTVLDYLEFCKLNPQINHYDHGIVGGLWFYDSMMKNYLREFIKAKDSNPQVDFYYFFSENGLLFCEEQRKVFAYLADCIIAHNMWPANESTRELYQSCRLDELILPRFRVINFKRNPILYILAISDTIEPVKTFDGLGLQQQEIWSGIDFRIIDKKIIMTLLDTRMPFERIAKKVLDLSDWIDVDVITNEEKKNVEIQMKID